MTCIRTGDAFFRLTEPAMSERARRSHSPTILCVADDAYAMPLAVTLRTAAQHLRNGSELTVYVVDAGIAEGHWMALKESIADQPIELIRVAFDADRLAHLPVSHHISHAAYARLLAAEILPAELSRVIYLDSDLLVLDDLTLLWETPLDGAWCLAVPDIACPFIDARRARANFRSSSPYMATIAPVRNWSALRLAPGDHYFNSGVLVIDLAAWRRENLAAEFLACLVDRAPHVWCWDQYALNVVLAGHWRRLPLRWNVGSHLYDYPSRQAMPLDDESVGTALLSPAILHFTSEFKPWRYGSRHPQRARFFAALAETAWHDWQPQQPRRTFAYLSQQVGGWFQRKFTVYWRWFAARWNPPPPADISVSTVPAARLPILQVDVGHPTPAPADESAAPAVAESTS